MKIFSINKWTDNDRHDTYIDRFRITAFAIATNPVVYTDIVFKCSIGTHMNRCIKYILEHEEVGHLDYTVTPNGFAEYDEFFDIINTDDPYTDMLTVNIKSSDEPINLINFLKAIYT